MNNNKTIQFEPDNPQFTTDGVLHHFLSIEGLTQQHLQNIFDLAESYIDHETGKIRKIPALHGNTVINIFFEPSTRTRTTFELAEQKLTADFINLNVEASATRKGETMLDTVNNLEAMQADMFVIRHQHAGAVEYFARHVGSHMHVVNAGDGSNQHPTQAMLDMFTILQHKPSIQGLTVAIVGDIRYSRVARSQIQALHTLKAKEIRIVGPKTLMPAYPEALGVTAFANIDDALKGVDVVIMLRLQRERMTKGLIPSLYEYFRNYGLNERRLKLAQPDAIVMHPGPINRNVEIDSLVADSPQSVILQQVTLGIAVRMAVMATIMGETE